VGSHLDQEVRIAVGPRLASHRATKARIC
jgi:hypothetical protein